MAMFWLCSHVFVISSSIDACKVNKPCKNGATCVAQQGGYSCLCTPGFLGKNCDQGKVYERERENMIHHDGEKK